MKDSYVQVVLEIPEHLRRGLSDGSLIQNAAGVIRRAPGREGGGQVVAHLQSVEGIAQVGGPLAAGGGGPLLLVSLAGQAVCTAIIMRKLGSMHRDLKGLIRTVEAVAQGVEAIRAEQFRAAMVSTHRGVAAFKSFIAGERSALQHASVELLNGRAGLQGLLRLNLQNGAWFDLSPDALNLMLECLVLNHQLELEVLVRRRSKPGVLDVVNESYTETYAWVARQLGSVRPPSQETPSLEFLRSEHEYPDVARLAQSCADAALLSGALGRHRLPDLKPAQIEAARAGELFALVELDMDGRPLRLDRRSRWPFSAALRKFRPWRTRRAVGGRHVS